MGRAMELVEEDLAVGEDADDRLMKVLIIPLVTIIKT
jgi:hypothetical protein